MRHNLLYKKFTTYEDISCDGEGYLLRHFIVLEYSSDYVIICKYRQQETNQKYIFCDYNGEISITMKKFNEIDKEFIFDALSEGSEFSTFCDMIESINGNLTIIDWDSDYIGIKINDYELCFDRSDGKFVEISKVD